MSKKQQTLFQSWHNGSKAAESQSSKNKPSNGEIMLFDSDGDEELLLKVLDESLRDHQSNQGCSKTNGGGNLFSPTSSSTSGYSTGTPGATLEEHLPGFDNAAGKTWIYPTNKPVRKYQRDIVETCLFHNTLVTLPTGLGKTFIAAVVMYNFFRWYPRGKIIFMAPTKPLVAQQIQACYEIMGIPLEATSEMTGAMNPGDRKKQWKEKRVFFLTPQVLTNDISRAACPANEVKCLVLDEAHKALGNYSYVQVVQELCKHGAVFRILALSATPGSDMKAIQQVVVNLRISKIELRNEESPDILPYVHNRNIEKTVVPLGPEITQVRDTFFNILGVYARRLMTMNVLFAKDIGSLTKYMVIQARERFRQNPPDNFPRNRAGMTEGDFAICITLTHALELLLQHGIRGFYNFLAGKTDAVGGEPAHNRTRTELLKVNGFSQMMEELKSKFGQDCVVGSSVSHPKLFKLREIVVDHFQRAQQEGRPTRVMIFSQYRDSVHEIVALLEQHSPLIKAMSFVGHGSSSGGAKTKGFTQADQIRVIKEFSEGNYNTLVSTCVGEEGLDIGDVDMIICYDVHKSPVRLVQRCGRTGRKRDGRIVMLMTEGKEEHVFNQSMLQKKSLLKNIEGNAKLKEYLLSDEPRLIPRHLRPMCHEMPMQVTISFPVPAVRPSKSNSSLLGTTTTSAAAAPRKSKTTKCFYLSDAEMEFYNSSLRSNQLVPVVPDWKKTDGQLTLNLDKWLPWQGSLQPYRSVGHSTLTKNYVNIVELIQSQQENWYDNYRQSAMDVCEVDEQVSSPPQESGFDIGHDVLSPSHVQNKSSRASDPPPPPPPSTMSRCGLYSPEFLDLFNSIVSVRIDPPDIPSPPPFCFTVSTNELPPSCQTFHQVAGGRQLGRSIATGPPVTTTSATLDHSVSQEILASGFSPSQQKAKRTNTPIRKSTVARLGSRKSLFTCSPTVDPMRHSPKGADDNTDYNANMDVTVGPQTPPRTEAESSTFFLEASPILSQRPKRASVKRAKATLSPAPAKRLKLEASTTMTTEGAGPPPLVRNQDVQKSKSPPKSPTLAKGIRPANLDETLLSATQFLDLLDAIPDGERAGGSKKKEIVQPNFDLEVDFLDSSNSLPEAQPYGVPTSPPKHVTPNVTPRKPIKAPLVESPVFNFMGKTPSPSPNRPRAEFSLQLPFTPERKVTRFQKTPVKAEFSIDFPESWDDDEDVVPPSPVAAAPVKSKLKLSSSSSSTAAKPVQPLRPCKPTIVEPAVQPSEPNRTAVFDWKAAWDEGFELSLSDIEEIEVVEKANVVEPCRLDGPDGSHPAGPAPCNPKTVASSVKDSSAIQRELDDIFGAEESLFKSSIEFVEEKEKAKPTTDSPPIFTIDSDDCMFEITPVKSSVASVHQPVTSDEDSPVARRKVNRKRNPIMTQSTPIVQRKAPVTVSQPTISPLAAAKTTKRLQQGRKASCSFFDEEADLSLVDGSCSADEHESQNDFYEASFVDTATQVVTDTMKAVYLKSVRSPAVQRGFVFREPSKQMNRSEIFSQAVVEQDSNYELDSFCVESDGLIDESTWVEPSVEQLPARTRAAKLKKKASTNPTNPRPNSISNNNRRRKRIVFHDSSSDDDGETQPPAKKLANTKENHVGPVPKENIQPIGIRGRTPTSPTTSSTSPNREKSPTKQVEKKKNFDFRLPTETVATSSTVVTPSASSSGASHWSAKDDVPHSTSSSPPRTLLVSSRQVATTTQVISTLQVRHATRTHVCSFEVADFVVSSQLGVIRKLHSEFANGSSRCRLQEQVRRLVALYDKPFLIVEADRSTSRDPRFKNDPLPDASSIIFKPNTPYFLQTLALLAQTEMSVLHSESQEHTARLLNDLGRLEMLKGFTLPNADTLSPKQEGILKFLHRIPEINPGVGLLMATQFRSLREILCSSAETISLRCKITADKAGNIVHAFRVNHAPSK